MHELLLLLLLFIPIAVNIILKNHYTVCLLLNISIISHDKMFCHEKF